MANCILCSRKLNFFNSPTRNTGKLKDGGTLCVWCCRKLDTTTYLRLHLYTLAGLKKLLQEKETDALLQKKQKAGTLTAADRQLLEQRAQAEQQKKIIQQIIKGLLQQAIAKEQKIVPLPKINRIMQMKDIFVCHASEDKKMFIEPLIAACIAEDISCWYDNSEIKWGDSIVKKVNHGLRNSRFVLVAISMNSIHKNWPNAELEASINMEFSSGETKVLPLLIGNEEERKMIMDHYPILRSKLYVNYSIEVKEITRLLKDRIIQDII